MEKVVLRKQQDPIGIPRTLCPECQSYNLTWVNATHQKCMTCKVSWGIDAPEVEIRAGVEL